MTIEIKLGTDGKILNSEPIIWTSPPLEGTKEDPIMFEFEVPKGLDCTFIKVNADNSFKV